ncbi:MAG: hypothetical protein FWH41_04395 [Treponema sp.]|nr:hypothetical protein [Treponema sp.]
MTEVLSPDEIDRLLKAINEENDSPNQSGRNPEKTLVATSYGHDEKIDRIAINSFSDTGDRSAHSNADLYCKTINSLKLMDNTWIFAKIISENTPYMMDSFLPDIFSAVILNLDDRAIQKVLRNADAIIFVKALKSEKEEVINKVLGNLSERGRSLWREDMEYMGPIRYRDVVEAREKILDIVHHLTEIGEIVYMRKDSSEEIIK